jgi:hypothetical protein
MHFLVTYGLSGDPGLQLGLGNQVSEVISRFRNHQALGNTYVVQVTASSGWNSVRDQLKAIPVPPGAGLTFVMTPLMASGTYYDGAMTQASWDAINSLSH